MDDVLAAMRALRRAGIVRSEAEFATRYLGRCGSYLSVTKAGGGTISFAALGVLLSRLRRLAAEARAVAGDGGGGASSREEESWLAPIILRLQARIDARTCEGRPR